MATYNGHKNWNHWNVSLWINNDECLYDLARSCRRQYRSDIKKAAQSFIDILYHEFHKAKTPDGAPYSVTSVVAAIREI